MKKRAYCFDCRREIEVSSASESCPLCWGDNWASPPKQRESKNRKVTLKRSKGE